MVMIRKIRTYDHGDDQEDEDDHGDDHEDEDDHDDDHEDEDVNVHSP